MFPIRFDFPFRKANGDLSTIGAEISAGGGGGGGYTLPTASAETKGGIKVGAGLSMEGETLVNNNPTPATPYTLPTASAETLGGIKVGSGLSIDENGALSASGGGGGGSIPYTSLSPTFYGSFTSGGTALTGDAVVTIYNTNTSSGKSFYLERGGNSNTITLNEGGMIVLILKNGDVIKSNENQVKGYIAYIN